MKTERVLPTLRTLNAKVVSCKLCPRLVEFREGVTPRASFVHEKYWKRPVPGFGDINGKLLVLGIAPALHGGNRTGRPFTGDASGRFLVKALFAAGFANKAISEGRGDGLSYDDCYLTAAVKCVPPGDSPTKEEFENCSGYLDSEISLMRNLRGVLALGALSFRAFLGHSKALGYDVSGAKFAHGATYRIGGLHLYASYHPSPRNTNTGRLTYKMLVNLLFRIKKEIGVVR